MHTTMCGRYPCDHAYRRSQHQGPHTVRRGEGVDYEPATGEWDERWTVANVAHDDEPWLVRVTIGDRHLDMAPKDAFEFTEALLKATHGMMTARLEDAEAAAELQLDDGQFGNHLGAEATTQPTPDDGGATA